MFVGELEDGIGEGGFLVASSDFEVFEIGLGLTFAGGVGEDFVHGILVGRFDVLDLFLLAGDLSVGVEERLEIGDEAFGPGGVTGGDVAFFGVVAEVPVRGGEMGEDEAEDIFGEAGPVGVLFGVSSEEEQLDAVEVGEEIAVVAELIG